MSEISRRAPSPSWNAQSTAPAAAAAANSNRWFWVKFKPLVTPCEEPKPPITSLPPCAPIGGFSLAYSLTVSSGIGILSRRFEKSVMLRSLMKEQRRAQSSTCREVLMNMLTHIPALASAFLGGVLLYLSIYLPIQSTIFAALLAGAGTMALAYSYGNLRQMTR
jgi:hypothetical protein